MRLFPGQQIRFMHYGREATGIVSRVGNGIVWLKDGRWLHILSVY